MQVRGAVMILVQMWRTRTLCLTLYALSRSVRSFAFLLISVSLAFRFDRSNFDVIGARLTRGDYLT